MVASPTVLSTVEKIIFLQRVPMFEELSSRNLRVISDIAEEDSFSAGTLVFEEGQPGDRMFIIVEGQIQIEKSIQGGSPVVLATLEKRDLLGDMALLDEEPRSASARAQSDTRVLGVDAGALHDLIREYPDIAFGLLRFCAQRIREGNKKLEIISSGAQPEASRPRTLTVTTGPEAGKVFTIAADVVHLGRTGGADMEALDRLSIADSARQVSRNHAEIRRDGDRFVIVDAGSVNGTFVNGHRLTGPASLSPGDSIRLGSEATIKFG